MEGFWALNFVGNPCLFKLRWKKGRQRKKKYRYKPARSLEAFNPAGLTLPIIPNQTN